MTKKVGPAGTARRSYRLYTRAYALDDDAALLDAMKASRFAIGGPEFIELPVG